MVSLPHASAKVRDDNIAASTSIGTMRLIFGILVPSLGGFSSPMCSVRNIHTNYHSVASAPLEFDDDSRMLKYEAMFTFETVPASS